MEMMTWEEIENDWTRVQTDCREYISTQECEAITKYCVGHEIREVARKIGVHGKTIGSRLDLTGMVAAVGSIAPLEARQREMKELIRRYGPKVDRVSITNDGVLLVTGKDAAAFEPYVISYMDMGQLLAIALRLAKAEWAAEAAMDSGVIKEDVNKNRKKVNKILFPEQDKAKMELDLMRHMAQVEQAARFLDGVEMRFLRRKSTAKKVLEANEKWLEQIERVSNLHPTFNEV
jgi:hypothetical protein